MVTTSIQEIKTSLITSKKNILLVEDDYLIAVTEQRILESRGYRVTHAASGEEALDIVREREDIDLILMDIDLGVGWDGTETAKRILLQKEIPISFLSSHTEPEIVEKTEGITSFGYIVKNSGVTVLLASIKMAFRLIEARKFAQEKERKLKESERYWKAILETARDGFWVLDNEGFFLDVNQAYIISIGYSREELLKLNIQDIDQMEDSLDTQERIIRILERGSDFFETIQKAKDGSLKKMQVSVKHLPDFDGKLICFGRELREREL